jgi:hypothetical protein
MNANPQNQQQPIDPMRGRLVALKRRAVPAGTYDAVFSTCEYRPATYDAMSGKGSRYPQMWFGWKIVSGQQDGQTAWRETPVSQSLKSKYGETIGWLFGAMPEGEFDLSTCVNKRYRIVVSQKLDKAGKPINYTIVTQCIAV